MQSVYDYIELNWLEAIEDVKRFCRQPSISAQHAGIEETATLTAELLEEYGIAAQILPAKGGRPVVYGSLPGDSPYTLLFYNHYDVQPPEPLELWTNPPFEPTIREGKILARGTSDDKGDIIARLLAIKAFMKTKGRLPISVKFFIEGEEEIGSPNIPLFIEENKGLLKADACFWEGGQINTDNRPEIILGVKGVICVDLEARGALRDMHSSLGTIVPNPAWRLIWALNSIKDSDENILIEGFYDAVRPPLSEELQAIRALPSDDVEFRENLGIDSYIKGLGGEELQLRNILQPACNINGFISGYTGEGSKTVLPCIARAKIDIRLVPDQRADDILVKLRKHLDKNGFPDIIISAEEGENPARTPLDSPFVKVITNAAKEIYGTEPIIKPSMTGSGPMFAFTETLGLPVASSGVSHSDSRPHAPDENIRLADFLLGSKHIAATIALCSQKLT